MIWRQTPNYNNRVFPKPQEKYKKVERVVRFNFNKGVKNELWWKCWRAAWKKHDFSKIKNQGFGSVKFLKNVSLFFCIGLIYRPDSGILPYQTVIIKFPLMHLKYQCIFRLIRIKWPRSTRYNVTDPKPCWKGRCKFDLSHYK